MTFSIEELRDALDGCCADVVFALLHGSARDGQVRDGGDIDLALFIRGKATIALYDDAAQAVNSVAPGAEVDIGILNHAEPVYRFEALKGRLLICRDEESYLRFFSLTCREYESQMASYSRQQSYRHAG